MITILRRHPTGFWTFVDASDSESDIKDEIRDMVENGCSVLDILTIDHLGISKNLIPDDLPTVKRMDKKYTKKVVRIESSEDEEETTLTDEELNEIPD